MMGCCWLRTGLVVFILYIDLVCSVKKFTPQTSKNSELRKIAVDSTGRNIYVGGKNFIYHLNEDLTQVGVVETGPREDSKECTKVDVDSKKSGCNIKEYDDYTQLLQVYEPGGILVTCGTLYLGRCVGRDLQNISIVNATSTSYLAVSADETVSTESVIAKVGTESLLFVGKSYVKTTENLENIYTQVRDIIYGGRLQENKFLGPYETNSGVKPTFSIKTVNKHADQKYDFVMKSMFYMSDNIYSLVRIMDLTTRRTVSKLSKMCAMGTSGANSYEDMPIECSEFSYVRDGFVVQHGSGEVLVALFSSTLDVTETTRCAVCVFTEDELLEGFRRSRMNHSSCGIPGSYPVDYLEIQENRKCMNNCLTTEPLCTILNTTTYCNGLLSLSSLIGVIPLTASPVYRGTGLTSLGGSFRNNLTAILVGTQTGTLHKLFLKSETAARLVKTSANYLDPPVQPIIDIVTTELNRTYLLGRHSVALLEDPVNCTKDSCSECMKIADSKCGWCVLDGGSCMEKTSCNQDEFWLPSLGGECLTLSTIPPGIRHQFTSLMTNVTVILSPPVPLTGNDWQCQYGSDECKPKGIPCKSDLIISESTMICQIQAREAFQQEYKLADFKIISKSIPSKVLAEGWSLLFYDCKGFKTCFECVNNPKAIACFWKTTEAECVNTHDSLYISYKNTSDCPQLSEMQIKLHKDKQTTVVIQAENLPSVNKTLYTCTVSNMPGIVSKVYTTEVICEVKVSLSGNVTVTYNRINIDHNGTVASKVYTCENLTTACSSCVYLNTQGYQCDWDLSTKKCSYNTTKMADSSKCPPPNISMISPRNGTISGRTSLTIHGTELGSIVTDINITVSGRQCEINKFSFNPPQWIQCYTGKIDTETEGGQVIVTRNSKQSTSNWTFKYLVPGLVSLDPIQGIKDGGRILTLKGSKLLTGNRHRMNVDLFNEEGKITCNVINSYTHVKNSSEIICSVGRYTGKQLPYRLTGVNVSYDDSSYVLTKQNVNFTFVDNPSIQIGRSQALRSGGVDMNITGERFRAVSVVKVDKVLCKVVSDNKVKCPVPAYNSSRSRRRRSSTTCPCGQVSTIHMDNYDYRFYMQFTENPTITPFTDIVSYKAGGFLTIEGEDLLRGAVESDYMVQVQSTNCHDVKVNANGTLITFKPPDFLSEGNEYQVEVLVGTSLRQHVGIIYYEKDLTTITIIAALGGTSLAMLVLIIICVIRSRRKDKQLNKLKTDIVEMESNIRNKSREVFADMQMSMQDIKGDLVTTGIPYFDYHNYSFHTLFPKLKAGESIYYQASATHQVEDFAKLAPRSILLFEELLKNKFFLQSLIGTLERQNKFSVQEKAEFSSLLTLTLMGKMTYISEVIEELLHRLIGRASRKQHRVLFRRSDSITQKLLSNWLALSLYPYLKGGGGQQLFMLYKASQTVMEKGPIDAVTLQAKDTLAEERLLKMDLQYESLTLEVDLNGRKELRYMCTVLDCDTITQVKAKCMYKIYKNKAASELHFTPDELVLEWHAGKGGKLVLNDIDRTSTKREGYVCRNTLKHYNVKDGSCMALLISDEPDDQELYYNTEATSMNDVLLSEHSMTSYMSMSPEKQWHMVFPEEDEKESRRQVLIEELYLNRLLHTKLTLMEYIDAVFENVLDEKRVPPVVCYLFKMFENIAKEHNVDPDIVSRWKSECYAMRIWSLWISCPDLLFDIILAKHVIPCLDVIKSMFSDVFSRTDSKLSKDSSSAKLLFANEVPKYQGEMRNFYDKVGSSCEPVTRQKFVSLMQEVSQQQTQEIKVKRLPALKKLFAMVKIFSDEIIADLDEEEETRDLKLGEKFDNVIQQMDTENV